jgi:hypothetical protein
MLGELRGYLRPAALSAEPESSANADPEIPPAADPSPPPQPDPVVDEYELAASMFCSKEGTS